jgi:hypothetical protein
MKKMVINFSSKILKKMEKCILLLKKWFYKMYFQETANFKEVGLK